MGTQIHGVHISILCFRTRYCSYASLKGKADYPQAKCKKDAQRNSEAIHQMHAAQIYAEM